MTIFLDGKDQKMDSSIIRFKLFIQGQISQQKQIGAGQEEGSNKNAADQNRIWEQTRNG